MSLVNLTPLFPGSLTVRKRQASIESAFTGDKFSQNKALNLYYK